MPVSKQPAAATWRPGGRPDRQAADPVARDACKQAAGGGDVEGQTGRQRGTGAEELND
jgi:hypothetical protein